VFAAERPDTPSSPLRKCLTSELNDHIRIGVPLQGGCEVYFAAIPLLTVWGREER